MFLWLGLGVAIGLVVGACGAWLVLGRRPPEPARPAAPLTVIEPPVEEVELPIEEERDMGRTAGEMLADLERKFQAMRNAEAEQAAKSKRKSTRPRARKAKP